MVRCSEVRIFKKKKTRNFKRFCLSIFVGKDNSTTILPISFLFRSVARKHNRQICEYFYAHKPGLSSLYSSSQGWHEQVQIFVFSKTPAKICFRFRQTPKNVRFAKIQICRNFCDTFLYQLQPEFCGLPVIFVKIFVQSLYVSLYSVYYYTYPASILILLCRTQLCLAWYKLSYETQIKWMKTAVLLLIEEIIQWP